MRFDPAMLIVRTFLSVIAVIGVLAASGGSPAGLAATLVAGFLLVVSFDQ